MNAYGFTRGTYYLIGNTGVSPDLPPTLEPTPSIHPRGLLQWQAGEFDAQATRAVEAERPCTRYPQDCADACIYVKSRGRTVCGWKAEA